MKKEIFDLVIKSNDIIEWSVQACLHAAQQHDKKVILEALSEDEQTVIGNEEEQISSEEDNIMLNQSIMVEDKIFPDEKQETFFDDKPSDKSAE